MLSPSLSRRAGRPARASMPGREASDGPEEVLSPRPLVLQRPRRLRAQLLLGLERPVRLAQQFAGEEDQVGVAA